MHKKTLITTLIIILAFFNYAIYQKENQLTNGKTVILQLAPIDPRSIMQGDYMRLNYTLSLDVQHALKDTDMTQGFVVVKLNQQHIASFVRLDDKTMIKANELKLPFKIQKYNQISFGGNTFFFQEGSSKKYEKAKYGLFKLHDKTIILQSLLDDKLQTI